MTHFISLAQIQRLYFVADTHGMLAHEIDVLSSVLFYDFAPNEHRQNMGQFHADCELNICNIRKRFW